MPRRRLEDQGLAALRQAMIDGRPDVAEHLLRALEALCPGAPLGLPAAEAYLLLAADEAPKRCR
jgi:hypothetical protein